MKIIAVLAGLIGVISATRDRSCTKRSGNGNNVWGNWNKVKGNRNCL